MFTTILDQKKIRDAVYLNYRYLFVAEAVPRIRWFVRVSPHKQFRPSTILLTLVT